MRKKLLLLAAALLTGLSGWAEDVYKDVTSTYLTNADFEGTYEKLSNANVASDRAIYDPEGWTINRTSGNYYDLSCLNNECLCWSNFSGKAQLSTGGKNTYWLRIKNGTPTFQMTQSANLPVGKYKFSADAYKSGSGGEHYLMANGKTASLSGNEDSWRSLSIDFELTTSTDVTFGFKYQHNSAGSEKFIGFDNFILKYDLTQALKDKIAEATTLKGDAATEAAQTLQTAIETATSKESSTSADEIETAISNLQSAINTYKAAAELVAKAKANLTGEIKKATALNTILNKTDLTTEISTATTLANNESATQTQVDNEVTALKAYYKDIETVSLSNASFDTESDWATANLSTGSNNSVTDWTTPTTHANACGSAFQIGSSYTNNGVTPPTTDMYGNTTGGVLGVSGGWGANISYSQTISSLPAGNYILYYEAYNNNSATSVNSNQCGLNGTYDQTSTFAKATWTANAVSVYVSDDVSDATVSIGYTAASNTSTNHAKMFYDNVIIYSLGWDASAALSELGTIVETANGIKDSKMASSVNTTLTSAISAAQGYITAGTCTKAQATEAKTNLNNAITAANTSIADYAALKTTLDNANAYTALSGSKTTLATAIETAQKVYDEATTDDCTETTNTLEAARETANVADYDYVHGASTTYTQTITTDFGAHNVAFQSGSGEGYKSGDSYKDKNTDNCEVGAYYTISLLKGSYVLEGYGRGMTGNNLRLQVKIGDNDAITSAFLIKGNSGLGVNTSGAADFTTGDGHEYNNSGAGYGWEYRAIEFTLDEDANVTLGVYGHNYANHWISAYLPVLKTTDAVIAQQELNAAKAELKAALDAAPSVPTEHVSESGAFDYNKTQVDALSSALSTAQGVYESTTASKSDVEAQTTAVKALTAPSLNAPSATQAYMIINHAGGDWTYKQDNKTITMIDDGAMTARAGDRSGQGDYNVQYQTQNDNFAQAMYFTQVEDGYNISWTDAEGATRYLCTGTPYGGNNYQIRTTTTASYAMVIKVSRNGDCIQLYNVAASQYLGAQDAGVYTVNSHSNFLVKETNAEKKVTKTLSASKYATCILPFSAAIPGGMNVYSIKIVDRIVELNEEGSFAACTPYLIYGTPGDYELSGVPVAYNTSYTGAADGSDANNVLVGVFTDTTVKESTETGYSYYILQTQDNVQGFYIVTVEENIKVEANKCYLKATTASTPVRAYYFSEEDEQTAITAISGLTSGNAKIYDLNGRQLQRLQKGINIVNGVKVLVK